jgi:hypothetical protein
VANPTSQRTQAYQQQDENGQMDTSFYRHRFSLIKLLNSLGHNRVKRLSINVYLDAVRSIAAEPMMLEEPSDL